MFQPNRIIRFTASTKWNSPDLELAIATLRRDDDIRIFTLYWDNGTEISAHIGRGKTARDAYRAADHERRRARYTIEGLLRKRRMSVQRELNYRSKLRLAGHCIDMTIVNFEGELDALRDEKEDLERELTDVRTAKIKAERELRGKDERIRQLERDGIEKDKGMTLIRQAFDEAGITGGNLIERVRALATERDQYKAVAQPNTAATAAS